MEPPDPGGTIPPVACFVTINNDESHESGMDTDSSSRIRKRSRISKKCKHCNKRKKRHYEDINKTTDCLCMENESIEKINNNSSIPKNPDTTVNTTQSPQRPSPIGRSVYESTDSAPYVVHVQRIQSAPNDGSTLHPIAFGRYLKKNYFKNIINGSVKRIGRNKVSLSFSNFNDANSFVDHNSLASENFKAYIPTFNVTRMGLIRGVPAEWSPEEIIENVSVPIGCGSILKVRRLNYKVMVEGSATWKPSQTVIVTFDGQVLPKRIFLCYNALPVDLYIYPTIQCFACCRFGHTKTQCRSKPRCFKCGQDHTVDSCNVEEDCGFCCNCSGHHFANSKSCPEYNRQKDIKIYMAESCVSYAEAAKFFPAVNRSFADVLVNSPPPNLQKSVNVPNSQSTSHKKTVFLKPRTPPKLGKGYDREVHKSLIKDVNLSPPTNGCALQPNNSKSEQSITDIILALINFLTQSNIIEPSNVAPEILNFAQLIRNNGPSSPVELSQCSQQKE